MKRALLVLAAAVGAWDLAVALLCHRWRQRYEHLHEIERWTGHAR